MSPTHPLTEEQVELLEITWARIKPISPTTSKIFFATLFKADPSFQTMLPNDDLREQGKKLMGLIETIVQELDTVSNPLINVIPTLQRLAKSNAESGATPEHYTTFGNSLLEALGKGLGNGLTPEIQEAWSLTYEAVADIMKKAAYGES